MPTPDLNWSNLYSTTHNLSSMGEPITVQEIKKVIKEWPSNKTGPDGFMSEFYKTFIHLLLPDIHAVLTHILANNKPLALLNTSHIVLIPKKETTVKLEDYRPISVVHTMQRILSKTLANRLQGEISRLVDCS